VQTSILNWGPSSNAKMQAYEVVVEHKSSLFGGRGRLIENDRHIRMGMGYSQLSIHRPSKRAMWSSG
jgi:hypothetical protein